MTTTIPTTSAGWTVPETASSVSDLVKKTKSIPDLGPKQALIKITAAALNYRDIMIATRSEQYPGRKTPDVVPGVDGAGVVVAAGKESKWSGKEGAPVVLATNDWLSGNFSNFSMASIIGGPSNDGTLQEYLVVDDEHAIEVSGHLDAVQQASTVTAGASAWAAIRHQMDMGLDGELREYVGGWGDKRLAGQTVLTQGTGGVSCFAIQVCP